MQGSFAVHAALAALLVAGAACHVFAPDLPSALGTNDEYSWSDAGNWVNANAPQGPTVEEVFVTAAGSYSLRINEAVKVHRMVLGAVSGCQEAEAPSQRIVLDSPLSVDDILLVQSSATLVVHADLTGRGRVVVLGKLEVHYPATVSIDVEILDGAFMCFEGPSSPRSHGGNLDVILPDTPAMPVELLDCQLAPVAHISEVSCDGREADSVMGLPLASGEVTIIVPGTTDVDVAMDDDMHAQVVQGMAYMLADIAGGVTSTSSVGYWVSDKPGGVDGSGLVKEHVTALTVAIDLTEELKRELLAMAKWLCRTLGQEAVFVSINGKAYLVADED